MASLKKGQIRQMPANIIAFQRKLPVNFDSCRRLPRRLFYPRRHQTAASNSKAQTLGKSP